MSARHTASDLAGFTGQATHRDGMAVNPAARALPVRLNGVGIQRPVLLGMTAFSCAGIIALVLMTRWGIGTSPDAVQYVRIARELLHGGSALYRPEPSLAHFSPLYPFLLATAGIAGADPLDAARWVNVTVFALNIFAVGLIVRRTSARSHWTWVIGSLLMCAAVPVLSVHAVALSEPLFLLLTVAGLYLAGEYLASASTRLPFLSWSALALGLAFLTRYAGFAAIITGAAAVLLRRPGPVRQRITKVLWFGVLASVPMLVWMLRNLSVAGTATGREFLFHPVNRSHVWQLVYTVSGWALMPATVPDVVRAGVCLVLAAGLGVALVSRRTGRIPVSPPVWVFALFVAIYTGFLALSISFFDANTPLDDRILLPVFAAGLIVTLNLVDAAIPWFKRTPFLAAAGAALAIVFAVGAVIGGGRLVAAGYTAGWGFSSRAWQESKILFEVRNLPPGTAIYSNAPEIVYLHTGRTARRLPKARFLMNQQPNRELPSQLLATRRAVLADCGVVVYFRNLSEQKATPTERELMAQLSLRVRVEHREGVILTANGCPQ